MALSNMGEKKVMSNSPQMPSAPTPEEPASSGNSNPVDERQPSPTQDARTWERWIRDIGFGIYILAALGLLFYAVTFQKLGLNWVDLRPYVIGIVALSAVLLILSYGWGWLKQADIGKKTQQVFATIILIFFVCIVAAAAGWVVIFILQEAGILSNREINGTRTAYPGPTPSTDNYFDIPLAEVTPEVSDTFIIPNYNPPKIDYSAFELKMSAYSTFDAQSMSPQLL
jgi:hypothetical protein